MSDLTLSLLGIYNQDPTILDSQHLILPTGMDRDVLLPMVLAESAELEVLYPDPATLKIVIPAWSRARCPSWQRMLEALAAEYDPLHNYDRTETETGSNTGMDTDTETETIEDGLEEDVTDTTSTTRTETTETSRSGSESTEEDVSDAGTNTSTGTSTGQVTGFNVQSFADNDKTINNGSGTSSALRDRDQTVTTEGTEGTSSDEAEAGSAIRDRDQSYTRDRTVTRTGQTGGSHSRTLRAFGNIGVTTSQEMLQAELEVRIMDIYRLVVDELIAYFCLRVY